MSEAAAGHPDRYQVDDLVVDLGTRQVFRAGDEIQLPKLSFDLFVALIEAAPAALSVDELTDRVWQNVVVSPATVSKRVELLRQALGDESAQPRYVALVRGHGYRLLPKPSPELAARKHRNTASVWIAAALVLAIGLVLWFVSSTEDELPAARSVVVLPFTNLDPHSGGDHMSDGLAIELTSLLKRVPDLEVIERTSAFAFKDSNIDAREAGNRLGVDHVVSGSVKQSGERLEISAQLTDGRNGQQIWSRSWDRDLAQVFDVQEEIAEAIVESLPRPAEFRAPSRMQANTEAYDFYLRGKSAFASSKEPDLDENELERTASALSLTMHALAIDHEYAPAWSQLAAIQYDQAQWINADGQSTKAERAAAYERAEASAHRALELDPNQAIAQWVLGNISAAWYWNTEETAERYRQALTVAPSDARTLNGIAVLYRELGRFDMAHRYTQAAFELDPFNVQILLNFALSYQRIGESDAARAQLEDAQRIAPNSRRAQVFEVLFAYLDGDYELAASSPDQANPRVYACALHKSGKHDESRGVLEQLLSAPTPASFGIASVYACQGDKDNAFVWLERAYKDRDPEIRWMRSNAFFRSLHDDPRWQQLAQKVGVSDEHADRFSAALGEFSIKP